jgi:hypothetical protein
VFDDCWTAPEETVKKEELAVQQPRRIATPFPDVSPEAFSSPPK